MELNVKEVVLPKKIDWNYEELKAEITEKAKIYETMVYTDDQIKLAKSDKAKLNHLKKALNDERIAREREYMKPFNEFKTQINEIISIIDKPVSIIDKQVKEYDQIKKQEKAKKCLELFEELNQDYNWLDYNKISNPKWTNATFTLNKVQEEIEEKLKKIANDLNTLSSLEAFSFEAIEEYKISLDVGKAIAEGQRLVTIQKRKEEQERAKAEAEVRAQEEKPKTEEIGSKTEEKVESEDVKTKNEINSQPDSQPDPESINAQWVSFSAKLTIDQAKELKEFFDNRNIEFKAI